MSRQKHDRRLFHECIEEHPEWGAQRIAAHLDMPLGTSTIWLRQYRAARVAPRNLPTPPTPPARSLGASVDIDPGPRNEDGSPEWVRLSQAQFLSEAIAQLSARYPGEKGIAAVQTMKLMLETKRDLVALAPVDDGANMSATELAERIEIDLRTWPDQLLELALREYGTRHRGRVLLVTESYHAELSDTGWATTFLPGAPPRDP